VITLASPSDDDPWLTAMRHGDCAAAWHISDAVLRARQTRREDCSRWPRHLQYIWDGTPLEDRRVLVRCYHGLGDTLQFVRLLEPLRQRAREVTLWVQPSLLELLSTVRGIDRLLPLHDGTPQAEFDVDIELMEVAHALRIDLNSVAKRMPYIDVSGGATNATRSLSSLVNVGLAWRSGDWDAERSIPTSVLGSLARVCNVAFHSLQYPLETPPFKSGNLACKDIAQMAQAMTGLDLVITVDTMVAHLAGALALPTWILLADRPDWRWMEQRTDTPWYPTMRLFRKQGRLWEAVLDEVCSELAAVVATHGPVNRRPTAVPHTRSNGCTTFSD
jgi:hypothetical protein